ncbi:alpha-1,6-mannosylglycoprotein 6-beta-N-acetylglucosaminyltransferase B-like isoform X3 [Lates japonicus]|uniref:alpha-1,6-mannosyl-glycoprotein 6-beta-N-acetylglucosaminyltransferase n=1 Tax=Lates japonicus TaxID=270547 RepID=A0AAD3N1F5_LATJO|nr:alpha-1,6-mannosylglycoprotein 6-beta-N-acetylglucosaminyltransferase B-like isoform X3 [Lates japonicus]
MIDFQPSSAASYLGESTHTPDNSFMGFVSEELNETEKRSIQQNKVNNMAVVYGKEASMWKVSSQHPYAEQYIGKPHVMTVDYNNSLEFDSAIREIMRTKVEPYLPYEYTCEGMLERVHAYIQHQPLVGMSNVTAPAAWPPQLPQAALHLKRASPVGGMPVSWLSSEPATPLHQQQGGPTRECGSSGNLLLFSCAGHSQMVDAFALGRDFRRGQVICCAETVYNDRALCLSFLFTPPSNSSSIIPPSLHLSSFPPTSFIAGVGEAQLKLIRIPSGSCGNEVEN